MKANLPDQESWFLSEERWDSLEPGERLVKIVVHVRRNETGEVRRYNMDAVLRSDGLFLYPWIDGNYACDCNRELFFGYAIGLSYADMPDRACTEGQFSVNLENPASGRIHYQEFFA